MQTSRRAFVLGSAGSLLAAARLGAQPFDFAQGETAPLTAQQVIDRIKTALGPPKPGNTVDGFKAGDPATVVTGIATTAMATVSVLTGGIAEERGIGGVPRANLIITYEPLFYTANDDPGPRATDPIYLAKKKLIDDGKLVVYRLCDQWLLKNPSAFSDAFAQRLSGKPVAGLEQVYEIPEITLGALVTKASLTGSRVVGDPNLKVRRVFVSAGTTSLAATMAGLRESDVALAGEPREWEAVPYVLDAITAGQAKGMIVAGRIASEEPGMSACARWIQSLVPGLSVRTVSSGTYWKAS